MHCSSASLTAILDIQCIQVWTRTAELTAASYSRVQALASYTTNRLQSICLSASTAYSTCMDCIDAADMKSGSLCTLTQPVLHVSSSLQALARCHKLQVANFTWCVQLTDDGVCPLAAGCPALESLSLHGLRGITNRTVAALAMYCSNNLHTIDVQGCIGIKTDESSVQAYLQKQLPNAKQFVIHT